MKKLMALLLCAGLLSSSLTFAIMSPKRLWQCRPSSPRPDCSEKERAESKKWLVGGIASVIAAVLAGLGIAATISEVKNEKEQILKSELRRIDAQIKFHHEKIESGELAADPRQMEVSSLEELQQRRDQILKQMRESKF